MANEVYANGMELACKAGAGKTICAFPDVCFTPPENPATPPGVPLPYPNTGFASDTTEGSKTVKISDKEIMLKNKSYFKTSTGDEAGCAAKKGVISSKHKGKVYFIKWSMDVKFEGENVDRHLDMTTNNHGSLANEAVPWPFLDAMSVSAETGPCAKDIKKEKSACKDYTPHGSKDLCAELKADLPFVPDDRYRESGKPGSGSKTPKPTQLADKTAFDDCMRARRCALQLYDREKTKCCSPQTPHHLIEASALFVSGRGGAGCTPLPGVNVPPAPPIESVQYNENNAPCVCAEGTGNVGGTHGAMHTFQSLAALRSTEQMTLPGGKVEKVQTYKQAKQNSIEAMEKVFGSSFCDPACIEKQIDDYHEKCGLKNDTNIKAVSCGKTDAATLAQVEEECAARFSEFLLSKLG